MGPGKCITKIVSSLNILRLLFESRSELFPGINGKLKEQNLITGFIKLLPNRFMINHLPKRK
jgi:hypothetical protein